jgi:hypothetical protein
MNRKQIEELLEEAKLRFLRDEAYLLVADVNERSLTHKFAEHLQAILGREWSVDCEYNRYGTDTKTIEDVKEIVGRSAATDETRAKTVYPDIIVHRRGVEGPNVLVIEAKKMLLGGSGPMIGANWKGSKQSIDTTSRLSSISSRRRAKWYLRFGSSGEGRAMARFSIVLKTK